MNQAARATEAPSRKQLRRWRGQGFGDRPLCYLCGRAPATTDDHVPPQGFFPKNYQHKGYKVPACLPCNNLLTKDEEYVREIFSLAATIPEADEVFEAVVRNYQRSESSLLPRRRVDRLLSKLTTTEMTSDGGIYLGQAAALRVETSRIERLMGKIAQGLYFFYLRQRMPASHTVDVVEVTLEQMREMANYPVHFAERFDNFFIHRGTLYTGLDESSAIWALGFYHRFLYIVFIDGPLIHQVRKQQDAERFGLRQSCR